MKIDNDLRQAIKAAHKHQRQLTHTEKEASIQDAIAKFLNERPAVKKQVMAKMRRKVKLRKQIGTLTEEIDNLPHPLGLDEDYAGTGIVLHRGWDGKFLECGGDRSAINHHQWDVDFVLAELAAADPKQVTKILAKYGINWT